MFVKWQRRRSTSTWELAKGRDTGWQEAAGDLFMASLVESRRVNGKPRHKLITYLGSIREKHAQGGPEEALHQDNFWRGVARRLGRSGLLGNRITPDDRAKIEKALAKRVRRPKGGEVERVLAEKRKELESYRNINGQPIYPNPTDEFVRERAGYS